MKPHATRKLCSAASIARFLTLVPDVSTRWGVTFLLLAAGCYPLHWARKDVMPSHFGRLQQVKIWSCDSVFRWHAVVMTNDSITGVPYYMPANCDRCRLGLEWSSVDSIHIGYPASPRENVLLWVLGAGLVVLGFYIR